MTMVSLTIPLLPSSRLTAFVFLFIPFSLVWAPTPTPSPGTLSIKVAASRLSRICRCWPPLFLPGGAALGLALLFFPVVTEFFHVHADHVPDHLSVRFLSYVDILGSVGLTPPFVVSHFCQDFKVRFWTFSTILLIDLGGQVHEEISVVVDGLGIGALLLGLFNHEVVEGKAIGLGQITNRPFVVQRNFNRRWRIDS